MGTSQAMRAATYRERDHPHAYGDKLVLIYGISLIAGSSPRVWGQDMFFKLLHWAIWIIPTRMGTRQYFDKRRCKCRDHPHAYGDKWLNLYGKNMDWGSSPRVWGQVDSDFTVDLSDRIIPTRMGTSDSPHFSQFVIKDHPHAYGDKQFLT